MPLKNFWYYYNEEDEGKAIKYDWYTVSGAIASFNTEVSAPLRNLTANISYTQDLHGYDSPWPAGGGKNLLNYDVWKTVTISHGDAVWENNGVKLVATDNDCYTRYNNTYYPSGARIPITQGETITISWEETTNAAGIVYIFPNGNTSGSVSVNNNSAKRLSYTAGSGVTYVTLRFGVTTSGVTIAYKNIQVVKGTTIPTWSPYENICPISGFTGVNVTRTGKNLLPNNLTFTNGVRDDDGDHSVSTISHYTNAVPIKSNTVYTFKGPSNSNYRVYFLSDGQSWISRTDIIRQREFSFTTQSNCKYIQIQCSNSVNLETAQLELGSTATDYEPYQGNTYSVTFPDAAGTVYGGTLDVVSGLLTVDRAMVNLGTLTWEVRYTETNNKTIRTNLPLTLPHAQTRKIISENYKYQGAVAGASVLQHPDNLDIGLRTYYKEDRLGYDDIVYAVIPVSESPDGLLVYELAEPVTYQLTPTEVTTLLGDNTIWADTGDVTVTY